MAKKKSETISVEGSRAIWSGNLGWGIMNIPVKLFSATTTSEVKSMKQICPDCKTPIAKKNHCDSCQKDLAYGDLRKGYRLPDKSIVEVEEHEMDYIKGDLIGNIKASGFVKSGKISDLYLDKPYFMAPQSAENYQQYNLLAKGLREYGMCLLVKMAVRSAPKFALVKEMNQRLVLQTVRYDNEVRDIEAVPVQQTQIGHEEMTMFKQIMDGMTIDDVKLDNDIEDRFQDFIQKKISGQPIDIPKPKQVIKQSDVSLLDQLKAQAKALETAS